MGPRRTLRLSLILAAALAIVLALSGALTPGVPVPVEPPPALMGAGSGAVSR